MKKGKFAGLAVCALAFAAVAGAISAHAVNAKEANASSEKTLYCKVSQSWWKADGAAVGAYYWKDGGDGPAWPGTRMTAVSGEEDMWSITIDTSKYESIIFVRVNSSGDIADWGAKTADLTIPTDGKNLYTITSSDAVWGDPGVTGEWSTYAPASSSSEEAPVATSEEPLPIESSEEELGPKYEVSSKYALIVDGVPHELAYNEEPLDPSFDEYYVLGVEVEEGQHVWFYDSETYAEWIFTNLSGSEAFEVVGSDIVCNATGVYDFYAKFKYDKDELYIGEQSEPVESSEELPVESSEELGPKYEIESRYALIVDGVPHELTENEEPLDPSFHEYYVLGVEVETGQHVWFYDSETYAEWIFTNLSGSEAFEVVGSDIVCNVTGVYDFYAKFKYDEDELYIGEQGEPVESSEEPAASSEEEFVDESLAGRYYIIGEGSFNKDDIPTWTYKSGILLDEPTGESTDLAVGHEVALKAGDVIKFRVGQAPKDQGYIGYSAIEVGADLFNNDKIDNIVVKADSTYNIYINSEGKLYIYDTQDPVVLSGHIYYGAGADGVAFGDTYIYTWKVEGTTEVPTSPWPGVKLSTLAGVRHSTMLNFAGSDGSVFEIPGTSLGDATHFIINNGYDVQTADFEYADGHYYSLTYSAGEGDANLAAPAKLALDMDLAIDGAKDSSLCNMDADLGKDIKNDYDKLSAIQKVLVDGSTFYTINVNSSGEEDKKIDVLGSDIIHMIDKAVIASPESPLFSTKAIGEENKALYITLTAVGIATAIGIAVYVIQRKKRHQ